MGILSSLRSDKSPNSPTQIWDKQFYTKLADDTDTETADLIWQSFRNALSSCMTEWKTAAGAKDYAKIRQIAHKTRSSSLLLGFRDFAALNQKIEQNLADNVANSDMDHDLKEWSGQAAGVIEILDQQPATLLGQQPVSFTEDSVDTD